MECNDVEHLRQILRNNAWFMDILKVVYVFGLPDWCVGAGVIRNMVWDYLHGYLKPSYLADVDVVFFDLENLDPERDQEIQRQLTAYRPDVPWEVTNQAGVHLWFEHYFGYAVEPLTSIEDAVSTWPETATCVAAYLSSGGQLEIIAPLGLADLFDMVVRRNPRRVSQEVYQQRIVQKQYPKRWPNVRIIKEKQLYEF
jgi:hypothetical protein